VADDRNWMLARHPAAVDLEPWPRRTRMWAFGPRRTASS